MRLPRVRFTVQRMMIAVTVLSIPLALWCWRIKAGLAFRAWSETFETGFWKGKTRAICGI